MKRGLCVRERRLQRGGGKNNIDEKAAFVVALSLQFNRAGVTQKQIQLRHPDCRYCGMIRILLVEDNPVDAFIAERMLLMSGADARLEIASSAAQAIDLLTSRYLETRELPDLLLVDQYMPMADGLKFLEAFAALDMPGKDNVLTLMLTSSGDPHLIGEALRRGAHGLVAKPISIPMLADLVVRTQQGDAAARSTQPSNQ